MVDDVGDERVYIGSTVDKRKEMFLQALISSVVTWGGRSNGLGRGKPLRLWPRERTFDSMNSERPAATERRSFDEIILPHLDAAHNLARWLVRDTDEAEDVAQEACLRAFRYFDTFRGGNARAWLLAIVRTTAFGWLQKNRSQQLATEFNEEIHDAGGEAVTPETLLLQRADTDVIKQAMNHLPVRLREVLILRELEGLSYKEIAEVIGVPIGTVMSTLFRARERFRQVASDRVGQPAQPKGASCLSDAERQEQKQDAVPV
jgi:RNA polymerase sigma-70 factor (ECF subfamily)